MDLLFKNISHISKNQSIYFLATGRRPATSRNQLSLAVSLSRSGLKGFSVLFLVSIGQVIVKKENLCRSQKHIHNEL